jgi:hypothetical protein
MTRPSIVLLFLAFALLSFQNNQNSINDPEATALLQKVSARYKSYKNVSAGFKLLMQRPKIKPTDDERKLTDTLSGDVLLEGAKFKMVSRIFAIQNGHEKNENVEIRTCKTGE